MSVDASVTMLITGDPKARDVTYAMQLLQELLSFSPSFDRKVKSRASASISAP